jgi:gas vesicle protein
MRHDYDRQEASASTKLTYLLIGGGIGAVIALLFAPNRALNFVRISPMRPVRAWKKAKRRPIICKR